jgi:hypothetical protein
VFGILCFCIFKRPSRQSIGFISASPSYQQQQQQQQNQQITFSSERPPTSQPTVWQKGNNDGVIPMNY